MATKKTKAPLPKQKLEVVVAKDAFLSLIKKYKNTSILAGALVLALTSFMGISAFKVYSTHHDYPDGRQAVQSANIKTTDTQKTGVTEMPSSTTAPAPSTSTAAPSSTGVNSLPGHVASSNGSAATVISAQTNAAQLNNGGNCTYVNGSPDNKVCGVNSPHPPVN